MADNISKTNITVGDFPNGGIGYTAFKDVDLPTSATTAIPAGMESMGDFGEDGFSEGRSISQNDFRDAYGKIVLTVDQGKDYTVKVNLIEAMRDTVLKIVNGSANVKSDDKGVVSEVTLSTATTETVPLVFDTLLSNGYRARYVYDTCKVSNYDDIPHNKTNLVNYGLTFKAIPDEEGVVGHIYYAAPASATGTTTETTGA